MPFVPEVGRQRCKGGVVGRGSYEIFCHVDDFLVLCRKDEVEQVIAKSKSICFPCWRTALPIRT